MGELIRLFKEYSVPAFAKTFLKDKEIFRAKKFVDRYGGWPDFFRRATNLLCWALEHEAKGETIEAVSKDRDSSRKAIL